MKRRLYGSLIEFFEATDETQVDVAADLGITQSALSMIVNGKRMPRPDLALRIEQRTGVPVSALMRARIDSEEVA